MKFKIFTVLTLAVALFLSACGKSDTDLQKAATDKLAADKITGVTVAVKDGVATLTGEVADAATKSKAELSAKVDGIKSVTNNITIKLPPPPPPSPDMAIKTGIQDALTKAGCTGATVELNDGVATLNGTVPAAKFAECVKAGQEAGGKLNVKKVENMLQKGK